MRVSVRNGRIAVGPELREEVERRIYFALGRFGDVIREVTVNLADVHGPRAKTEKKSKLVVFLRPSEQVMAEATDATVIAAVESCGWWDAQSNAETSILVCEVPGLTDAKRRTDDASAEQEGRRTDLRSAM